MSSEAAEKSPAPLPRLLREMGNERWTLVATLLTGAITVALTVATPLLLGRVTDLVVNGVRDGRVDTVAVARSLLVVAVLVLASVLFAIVRGQLTAVMSQRVARTLRSQTQAKLARLPLTDLDSRPRGDVLARITGDVDNLSSSLQQSLGGLVAAALTAVGALAMMVVVSPTLTLVALATIPPATWSARAIARRARPFFAERWEAVGALNAHIEETYSAYDVVRLHGRADDVAATLDEHNRDVLRAGVRAQYLSGLVEPVLTFVGHLNYVAVAVAGGLKVASGSLSIGDVQAFIGYTLQVNSPVSQMAAYSDVVQSGLASAQRIFDLLDAPEQSTDPTTPDSSAPQGGRVVFGDVTFSYVPGEPVIDGLELVIEPGQTVAVVGATGTGKTTLINILLRFYEPSSGRVTIDGVDIAELRRDDLRRLIGVVLQDTWLFHGTIADNIAYGTPEASRDAVVGAARAARVDHIVRALPDGYGTVLGEDDHLLSHGERQLIAVARVFMTQPAVLVLDEATSSLDARTEMLIQSGLATLREGRTSLIIAHRLSTIRDADRIIVIADGRVTEHGTHDELLALGGHYSAMLARPHALDPVAATGD